MPEIKYKETGNKNGRLQWVNETMPIDYIDR